MLWRTGFGRLDGPQDNRTARGGLRQESGCGHLREAQGAAERAGDAVAAPTDHEGKEICIPHGTPEFDSPDWYHKQVPHRTRGGQHVHQRQ
ncbi:hypothetical protein HMPREF0569_1884 [Micrococcus luteus SK58]|nr:hypothetical protein HMPREF0569_1884 [Micrococcus luteus SK58]